MEAPSQESSSSSLSSFGCRRRRVSAVGVVVFRSINCLVVVALVVASYAVNCDY